MVLTLDDLNLGTKVKTLKNYRLKTVDLNV